MPYFNPIALAREGYLSSGGTQRELLIEQYLPDAKLRRDAREATAKNVLLEENASFLRSLGEPLLENMAEEDLERQLRTTRPAILFDIFLSFSSVDWTQVLALYRKLTGYYGKRVYVDRIVDPHLNPTNVSRSTAIVLRRRLAQSIFLFCATTQTTTGSSWVPWELGYEDGYNGKSAIVPITSGVNFGGREYFEIYPEVQEHPGYLEIHERGLPVTSWDKWIITPRRI